MTTRRDIGLEQALGLVLGTLRPLPPVEVRLDEAVGLVPACDLHGRVDSPPGPVSMKDGYALASAEIARASPEHPVRLRLLGRAAAGQEPGLGLEPGGAFRVLTGALLPEGADAVLAGEFAREEDGFVLCLARAEAGRNVRCRGSDAARGGRLALAGEALSPGRLGLLAAGGLAAVRVHPRPAVAVVATGDEVVAPGAPLGPGQVVSSNSVMLRAWLARFGMTSAVLLAGDRAEEIAAAIEAGLAGADALLTSGGAWKSERDLMAAVLDRLGVDPLFHRVRLGPGKAILFGCKEGKPLFCLAGGPTSCEMGFLQVALPGLLRLAGRAPDPFPRGRVRLAEAIGGDRTWTQFFQARLEPRAGEWIAHPLRQGSRLEALAAAEALLRVPEGVERLEAGEQAEAQFLGPVAAGLGFRNCATPPLPPVVCVVGRTGAGKTRLIERLLPALKALGLRVGTIKHDAHRFDLDRPGKDSDRHKKAGAVATLISSPTAIGMVRDAEHDHPIAALRERYLRDVDLILTEGYAREAWPKVEVHAARLGGLLSGPDSGLFAVVSEEAVESGVARFDWSRVAELARLLAERAGR